MAKTTNTAETTRQLQLTIAASLVMGSNALIKQSVEDLLALKKQEGKNGWIKEGEKFLTFFENWNHGVIAQEFSVFKKGNSKLPFWSFSSLPLASCPGANDCKSYCYSLKSWRFPAAFFRQVQNFLLQSTPNGMAVIEGELVKLTKKGNITLRLFVDGDFITTDNVINWWGILSRTPGVQAYGYSKSLRELRNACKVIAPPKNYILNLSSGSLEPYLEKELPQSLIRGRFIAVRTVRRLEKEEWGTKVSRQLVWDALGNKKTFVCPGDCGSCTGAGHACGNHKLDGIDIAIPIH